VQETLGKERREPEIPYPRLQETPAQIEDKAGLVRQRLEGREQELFDKLADVADARGWKVSRATNPEEVLDYICSLANSSGAGQVVRSDQEVFQNVPIDDPLSNMGVEVTVMAQTSGLFSHVLRDRAAQADIGITGVDYAIAETGSAVVIPRRGLSRVVSLLPPVHVAIVRPQELVESLEDIFILRRLAYHQQGGSHAEVSGGYMNFITGPSRTADIEQTLVIGAHGPKEAHLVLLSSS
jgi:L-lactate dehydrogenase complex protein LldG